MTLWVPAERLAAMIDAHRKPPPNSNLARKLFDFRHGRQGYVSLEAADRMLTELDLHYLLYIPREKGGLADIYEDGVQYGKPGYRPPDEQIELQRAQDRRRYERKKARRLIDPEYLERERARWRANKKKQRRAA